MRLPFLRAAGVRHARAHRFDVLVVGGNALEPADGDRFGLALFARDAVILLDAPAPARRLARPVASTSQNPGKYV